jgi:hypothetical protein
LLMSRSYPVCAMHSGPLPASLDAVAPGGRVVGGQRV